MRALKINAHARPFGFDSAQRGLSTRFPKLAVDIQNSRRLGLYSLGLRLQSLLGAPIQHQHPDHQQGKHTISDFRWHRFSSLVVVVTADIQSGWINEAR